ncbi:DUF5683 domain-containing protein [Bacteroidota bacterium]
MSKKITYILLIFSFSLTFKTSAQKIPNLTSEEVLKKDGYNPLTPATAAFYSAIIPGMGQLYNKDYWKFPVVYGALAIPIYYYSINANSYKRYRKAFKLRESGLQDEFTTDSGKELISREGLISAQKILKQNRDTSLLTFAALYALQVLEASVSAHLLQFNVNDKISFDPQLYQEPVSKETIVGLTLNIKF